MLDPIAPDREEGYQSFSAEPVTESDLHGAAARYLIESLRLHFADRSDVYVAGNLFVYYLQGSPDTKVSPDVFVCFGAEPRARKVYRTWVDGPSPAVVLEVTSESSRLIDQGDKRARYEMMGVEEYYLFDPLGEYLPGKLRAFERQGDILIPRLGSPLVSPRLGLELAVDGSLLRLAIPSTGETYATYLEEHRARLEEQQARQEAEARAEALEQELRRLRGQD